MNFNNNFWAFILGGTGSFGLATAKLLASKGFNLILVYRERKNRLISLEPEFEKLRTQCDLIQFNLNANETENQKSILEELLRQPKLQGKISFLLHAIADGNLRPLFATNNESIHPLSSEDFQYTINAMGTGMYQWTRLLYDNGFFAKKSSVLGLTSEGTLKVFKDYAAVASAKAVMETNMRYMAIELAQHGIRVNLINAGITDTNALKVFPSYENFIQKAKERNPSGRLTTAEDVAKVIAFLASEDSLWLNGSILTVDGGEQLISLY